MPKLVRLAIRDAVAGVTTAGLIGYGLLSFGMMAQAVAAFVVVGIVAAIGVLAAISANLAATRRAQTQPALIPVRANAPERRR